MRNVPVFLVAVLMAGGCSRGVKPPASAQSSATHVLVASSGRVEIRKPDWIRYSPVSFGEIISSEDIVRVGEGGEATVVCSDLSQQTLAVLPPGPVPCPAGGELGFTPPHLLLRGDPSNDCITCISPRAGILFDARPVIRWKPIVETRNYHVETKAGNVVWSRDIHIADDSQEGDLPYPGDAPPLPAGSSVTVVISGHEQSSRDCAPQKAAIRVLTDAERSGLEAADRRIRNLGLPDEETDFLRASLLLSRGIYADGIALLEKLGQAPAKMAAVYRLLGDAYLSVELPDNAEKAYREGLALATASEDLESRASLNAAVASLTVDVQYRKECAARAISLYKDLGDTKKAVELESELK